MTQFDGLMNTSGELDLESIKKIIPYDKPFLFIDSVLSLTNSRIVAIKNLTGKEEFFKGHFVDFPIMPGALTIEGMGHSSTLLVRTNIPNHQEKDILAYKLKEVSFYVPVLPGDQLRFEVDLIAQDDKRAVLSGKTFVKETLVAEALLLLAIVNRAEFRAKYAR